MRGKICGAAGMFLLQITLILVMLFAVTFDRAFYSNEYAKLGVYDICGADERTLELATDITLDYIKGVADGMDGDGEIDGVIRPIFGDEERAHMADVKWLFQLGLVVILATGICAIALMLISGRDRRSTAQGALIGIGIFILLIAAVVVAFAVDFNAAFTTFHNLLFSNDLWLMNPNTQFMIRMFPAQFFADMGLRIAAYTGIGLLLEIFVVVMTGFGRKSA